jgi:hypothetical protein
MARNYLLKSGKATTESKRLLPARDVRHEEWPVSNGTFSPLRGISVAHNPSRLALTDGRQGRFLKVDPVEGGVTRYGTVGYGQKYWGWGD